MLTICLEENYNIALNLKKSKSCTIINFIQTILILYLIDTSVLINILIAKKNKVVACKSIFYLY